MIAFPVPTDTNINVNSFPLGSLAAFMYVCVVRREKKGGTIVQGEESL